MVFFFYFYKLILQDAFKNIVKLPNSYLAIMHPKQMSHFRISPYHSSLTMLETANSTCEVHACYKHLCQFHSRPQIKAASNKERDGQREARGVKVMCPLWQVEDGKMEGPQLHPVPCSRGKGSGWTHRQTDTYRKIQPTKTAEGV